MFQCIRNWKALIAKRAPSAEWKNGASNFKIATLLWSKHLKNSPVSPQTRDKSKKCACEHPLHLEPNPNPTSSRKPPRPPLIGQTNPHPLSSFCSHPFLFSPSFPLHYPLSLGKEHAATRRQTVFCKINNLPINISSRKMCQILRAGKPR